jgi:hypothetical protein
MLFKGHLEQHGIVLPLFQHGHEHAHYNRRRNRDLDLAGNDDCDGRARFCRVATRWRTGSWCRCSRFGLRMPDP